MESTLIHLTRSHNKKRSNIFPFESVETGCGFTSPKPALPPRRTFLDIKRPSIPSNSTDVANQLIKAGSVSHSDRVRGSISLIELESSAKANNYDIIISFKKRPRIAVKEK